MLPRNPRTGKIHPAALHIAAEFRRLREQCAAEGLPDTHYGEPQIFVTHIYADHVGAFDPVHGQPRLSFKEPKHGLVRRNIVVERTEA
jgi:hypothetical protein